MLGLLISSCTKDKSASSSGSALRFVLPPHPNVSDKSLNTSLSSSTSNFCYFVNVLGPGLSQTPYTCAPTKGVASGFAAPSSMVEMTVPRGDARIVELFGYVARAGETCSGLGSGLETVPVNRIFRMARAEGVDMNSDTTSVTLKMVFPGIKAHYGVQAGLASSCYASLQPIPVEATDVSSPLLAGNRYKVIGKLGSGSSPKFKSSGGTYRVNGGTVYVSQ